VRLRILGRADLLHEKLRAGADLARRRSKRLQDLADAQALLEAFPELASGLTAEERARMAVTRTGVSPGPSQFSEWANRPAKVNPADSSFARGMSARLSTARSMSSVVRGSG
jgi:hypothetical protein